MLKLWNLFRMFRMQRLTRQLVIVQAGLSREQALSQQHLIDLTSTAAKRGFRDTVVCTRAVWDDIQAIPCSREETESVASRVDDVLTFAALTARNDGLRILTPEKMRLRSGRRLSWRFVRTTVKRRLRLRQIGSVEFYPMLSNDQGRVFTYRLIACPDQHGRITTTIFRRDEV